MESGAVNDPLHDDELLLVTSFDVGLDLVLDGIERLTELFPEPDQ